MKSFPWLFSLALLAAGCSSEDPSATTSSEPKQRCRPNEFVVCLCPDASQGTKKCSSTGQSFGKCANCTGKPITDGCTPGDELPCLCEGKTEGVQTCNEDGASVSKCRCDTVVKGDSESCPGLSFDVDVGSPVTKKGSTAAALDDFGSCGEPGPDSVYQITPAASGTLSVRVDAETFDPVLIAWSDECGSESGECHNDAAAGGSESLTLPVEAGVPVFIGVDSSGEGGDFNLVLQLEGAPSTGLGDQCPGSSITVGASSPVEVSGTTVGSSPDYKGADLCASAAGPDNVYVVQASSSGSLSITLQPQGTFDGALYVRTGSCTSGPQLVCSNEAGPGEPETVVVQATKGQAYSVFVDGSSAGAYSLSLSLSPVFCGDKKVAPPEQCDDGNQNDDDGCSSLCQVEQDPPNTACPGQTVFIFDGSVELAGSTDPYQDKHSYSDCLSITGKGAPDRVYQIMPSKSGKLHAEITSASFDSLLYTLTGACSGTNAKEGVCGDVVGKGGDELDTPVTAGTPVWLVVDGWEGEGGKAPEKGTFVLLLSVD